MLVRVMVVECGMKLRRALLVALVEGGCSVNAVDSFASAQEYLAESNPDVLVITVPDWGADARKFLFSLQKGNSIRRRHTIVVVGAFRVGDSVTALESGADDFLRSAISAREFRARVSAVLRLYSRRQER
jgi:DNA-binding response OmpR family regulator